jgi:hypothetical protein
MTKIARNRLSVLAWGASIFWSVLLLISAIAAAEHKREHMSQLDGPTYISAPTATVDAGN